jgi:hypothetical protein
LHKILFTTYLRRLDRCKEIAARADLDSTKFDLKTFRSTYATRMIRAGFDIRTVQRSSCSGLKYCWWTGLARCFANLKRVNEIEILRMLGEHLTSGVGPDFHD